MASTLHFSIASLCQQALRDGHKYLLSSCDWDKVLGSNYPNPPVTLLGVVYGGDEGPAVPPPSLLPASPPSSCPAVMGIK